MPPAGIDLKLRLSLREGSIYYFTERTLTSAEPHYFIVVNADPLTQQTPTKSREHAKAFGVAKSLTR